jgi:heterodisulfide reductase subunit C
MDVRRRLLAKVPEASRCFQCSTCSAGCPVLYHSGGFNPRQLILRALVGDPTLLASPDLWRCSTCAQCDERCPQDVNPFQVLIGLKNLSVTEGVAPAERVAAARLIAETGLAYPMSPSVDRRREKLGLPALGVPGDEVRLLVGPTGAEGDPSWREAVE